MQSTDSESGIMKISTKTRYGLRFMVDVAQNQGDGWVSLNDAAKRQGISKKYLEQVVSPLTDAGLLAVRRGKYGGFQLARPAEEITLADIVSASEDRLSLMDCLNCIGTCDREPDCIARNVWGGMQQVLMDYLNEHTLANVIRPQ